MGQYLEEAGRSSQEAKAAVRLRKLERRQMIMAVHCPEDLLGAGHPVRLGAAVVAKLDLLVWESNLFLETKWHALPRRRRSVGKNP